MATVVGGVSYGIYSLGKVGYARQIFNTCDEADQYIIALCDASGRTTDPREAGAG